jgi:hypothetical protein
MLRFRAYLREIFHSGIKTPEGMVDIYHNPNRKEIKSATSEYNDTRAIIKDGNIYAWDAAKEMHHRVRNKSGITGGIDALIDHGRKSIQLYGSPEDTREKFRKYESTPHFKQHFKDYKIEV